MLSELVLSDCICVCISCPFFWWHFVHNYLMQGCACSSTSSRSSTGGSWSTSYWGRTPGALPLQYPDKHDTISWQTWKNEFGERLYLASDRVCIHVFLVLKFSHFWWAVALLQIWGSTLRTNGMINDKQIFLIWGATAPLATRWLTQILRSNNRDYLVMIHRSSILNAHISGSISNTLESTMPARKHN